MKQFNVPKGKLGEEIASEYLRKRGYKILEENYRTRFGEIDLIITKDDVLVFVEVKLKIGEEFGAPEEMVDRRKIIQIERIAKMYLLSNSENLKKFKRYRIDVVAIVLGEEKAIKRVNYYENVGVEFI